MSREVVTAIERASESALREALVDALHNGDDDLVVAISAELEDRQEG